MSPWVKISDMPMAATFVPSVVSTGFVRKTPMRTPLTEPSIMPATMPAMTPPTTPMVGMKASAMMPDAAMLAGMDRSTKPPLVVTKSMPSAANPVKATD